MKKLLILSFLAVFAFAGCDYDDRLDDIEERVATLETLTKQLGDRLDAGAIITSVTALPDGVGWRFAFSKGDPIEILSGTNGESLLKDIEEHDDGTVTIVLSDGRSFVFPLAPTVDKNHTITFVFGNGADNATQKVIDGGWAVVPTTTPKRTGYVFKYWYANDETTAYNFDTPITADITLTAKWADGYYVKYGASMGGGSHFIQSASVNTESGTQTFQVQSSGFSSPIFGPVEKGFICRISVTGPISPSVSIYVSKIDEPFVLKKTGGLGATTYTIDF